MAPLGMYKYELHFFNHGFQCISNVSFRGKLLKLNKPLIKERNINLPCIQFLALMNFYLNRESFIQCYLKHSWILSRANFLHSHKKSILLFCTLLQAMSLLVPVQSFCYNFHFIIKPWNIHECTSKIKSTLPNTRVYSYVTIIIIKVCFALSLLSFSSGW